MPPDPRDINSRGLPVGWYDVMKDGSNFSFGCLKYVFIAGFLFFSFVVLSTSHRSSDPVSQSTGEPASAVAPAPNEGFKEPPQQESRELSAGECYDNGESPLAVFLQSCTDSHDGEVVGIATYDARDYPTGGISDQQAERACGAYFSDSVRQRLSDESLMFNSSRPSPASWKNGDRSIVCMIERGFHEPPLPGRLP